MPLGLVYGRRVTVTLSEVSSSIVVRSEHQYRTDDRFRLTLRKHLYEEITTIWSKDSDDEGVSATITESVIQAIHADIE